jgi:hypothetical protein
MAKTRKCRICGKEYPACATNAGTTKAFMWREVACSLEHAMEYFKLVEESRKPKPQEEEKEVTVEHECFKALEEEAEPKSESKSKSKKQKTTEE